MLVDISFKNWPSVVYIRYNDEKVTEKLFKNYQEQIYNLIDKINEYKKKNNNEIYVVINIRNMKNINLEYADKQSRFYDYIIKNINKNIKFIYLIVKDDIMKILIKTFVNLKYPKEKKIFKICKSKEKVQNKLTNILHKLNSPKNNTLQKNLNFNNNNNEITVSV